LLKNFQLASTKYKKKNFRNKWYTITAMAHLFVSKLILKFSYQESTMHIFLVLILAHGYSRFECKALKPILQNEE